MCLKINCSESNKSIESDYPQLLEKRNFFFWQFIFNRLEIRRKQWNRKSKKPEGNTVSHLVLTNVINENNSLIVTLSSLNQHTVWKNY